MMYKKFIQLLGMTLLLLTGEGCYREQVPTPEGEVTISFRVGETDTKAISPGDGNIADGGGIYCTRIAGSPAVLTPDLYIFICDRETGGIVKRYPGDGTVDEGSDWQDGNKSTFLSVSFPFQEEGIYDVYALANVGGGDSNLTLPSASDLAAATRASDLDGMMIGLASSAVDVGSRMPLSAKGSIIVAKGLNAGRYNGHVELQLLRCFHKVQFSFKNLTGATLDLYDCRITFRDLNVHQGWLFPAHPDFVALGDGNSDGKDDNYQDFASAVVDVTGIADEADRAFFADPVLFLPSVAPTQNKPSTGQRYLCDISFRVGGVDKSFTNLPIHTPKSLDITSMNRNQYLQIVTTVSVGTDVSFNFMVKEWEMKTEYVTFD